MDGGEESNTREHAAMFEPPVPSAPSDRQRRNALIQCGIALVIVVVIFGSILPEVVSLR